MKRIEFTALPYIESQYWTSDCGRYRILHVPGIRRPFRPKRKLKLKTIAIGEGRTTFEEAVEECQRYAKGG